MFKLLSDKQFWKNTMKLAIPVAVQNMLFSSFTLVDTLFVSSLGDVSLAAVGMSSQWGMLMNMALFGICSGTGVFVSQYWGVNDTKNIHKTMGIAMTFATVISMFFFSVSFFTPQIVIGLFNKDETVISEGISYLKTIAFVYPALAIGDAMGVVLRSTERVKLPMVNSAITTGVNIFLDYCMIFGHCGFKAMGVRGAALATVISSWLGVFVIIGVSAVQKNILITKLKNVFAYTKNDLKVFFGKAFPVMLNETLWGTGVFIFNLIWSNMGYEYYASVTILKTFENIAFVFFVGFDSACSVMIGKSIGGGKIKQAVDDSKRFLIINPLISVIIGAAAIIFRTQIVSIFDMGSNISNLTIHTAEMLILIYSLSCPVRMLGFSFIVGIFRAGGDTASAARFDLTALWLSSLPATLIAAYVFKLPFLVCYAVMFVFEDAVKVLMCWPHYKKQKWIKPVTEEGKAANKEI